MSDRVVEIQFWSAEKTDQMHRIMESASLLDGVKHPEKRHSSVVYPLRHVRSRVMRGLAAVAKVSPFSCGEALRWPVGVSSGLALLYLGSQRYISPSQVQSILIT